MSSGLLKAYYRDVEETLSTRLDLEPITVVVMAHTRISRERQGASRRYSATTNRRLASCRSQTIRLAGGLAGLMLALLASHFQADETDVSTTTVGNRLAQVRAKYDQPYVYAKSKKPDYLLDQDALRRYGIVLEDADLKFLNDNPIREQYVKAALLFEGRLRCKC